MSSSSFISSLTRIAEEAAKLEKELVEIFVHPSSILFPLQMKRQLRQISEHFRHANENLQWMVEDLVKEEEEDEKKEDEKKEDEKKEDEKKEDEKKEDEKKEDEKKEDEKKEDEKTTRAKVSFLQEDDEKEVEEQKKEEKSFFAVVAPSIVAPYSSSSSSTPSVRQILPPLQKQPYHPAVARLRNWVYFQYNNELQGCTSAHLVLLAERIAAQVPEQWSTCRQPFEILLTYMQRIFPIAFQKCIMDTKEGLEMNTGLSTASNRRRILTIRLQQEELRREEEEKEEEEEEEYEECYGEEEEEVDEDDEKEEEEKKRKIYVINLNNDQLLQWREKVVPIDRNIQGVQSLDMSDRPIRFKNAFVVGRLLANYPGLVKAKNNLLAQLAKKGREQGWTFIAPYSNAFSSDAIRQPDVVLALDVEDQAHKPLRYYGVFGVSVQLTGYVLEFKAELSNLDKPFTRTPTEEEIKEVMAAYSVARNPRDKKELGVKVRWLDMAAKLPNHRLMSYATAIANMRVYGPVTTRTGKEIEARAVNAKLY